MLGILGILCSMSLVTLEMKLGFLFDKLGFVIVNILKNPVEVIYLAYFQNVLLIKLCFRLYTKLIPSTQASYTCTCPKLECVLVGDWQLLCIICALFFYGTIYISPFSQFH